MTNLEMTTAMAPPSTSRLAAIGSTALTAVLLALALLAAGAGYGRYRFGTFSTALAFLKGERVVVDAPHQMAQRDGTETEVVFRYGLTNLSGRPLRLVGMTTSCTCTVVDDLPMTIDAAETRPVTARISVTPETTGLSGTIQLYTDEPSVPVINLAYAVRSAPPPGKR